MSRPAPSKRDRADLQVVSTWSEHDRIDDGNDAGLYRGKLEADELAHHAVAHRDVRDVRSAIAHALDAAVTFDLEAHGHPGGRTPATRLRR